MTDETQANIKILWETYSDRLLWCPAGNQDHYYFQSPDNRWMKLNSKNLLDHLLVEGLYDKIQTTPVMVGGQEDRAATGKQIQHNRAAAFRGFLVRIREKNQIDWAGELAGWRAGRHFQKGQSFLVTRGLQLPVPLQGDWSFIRGILWSLFSDDQRDYVLAWLQHAYRSLKNATPSFGQILIIAGEKGDGKTLFQAQIVTALLGGRDADATRYLVGGTPFNLELSRAEHWRVDDLIEGVNYNRRLFADGLKKFSADPTSRIEGKGVDAVNVTLNQRCSVAINTEGRNMAQLPELTGDLRDKVIVVRSSRVTGVSKDIGKNNQRISSEMPAFVHWLDEEYVPPDEVIGDHRFHVNAFHHQDIVEEIRMSSAAHHVREILENHFSSPEGLEWKGYTSQLLAELNNQPSSREALRSNCTQHPNRFAQLVSEIAKHDPGFLERGDKDRARGYRYTLRTLPDKNSTRLIRSTLIPA